MDLKEVKKLLGIEFSLIYDAVNPIIKNLNLDKDSKILDVGTGSGRMAITLAFNGFSILTGEPDDDISEYAKRDWLKNAKKVNVDHLITFTPFHAEKMPFNDEEFDAVFIMGALHHIDNKKAALEESVRVIKSGGVICVIEPSKKMLHFIKKEIPTHPDIVDPRDFAVNLSVEYIKGEFFNSFIIKKQ
ncbi:MAG: class I SAM-dependent methyltransferase [Promethearchaeota archaeon]